MFCASPNFDYDNPGKENAYENGCAKENNHSFSIWGDE